MNMKKITTIAIVCLLALGIFAGAAAALEKEEVVYVNLTASGDVKDVNVVNIFEPEEPQYLVDYGEYESVRNLSTTDPIVQTGDENMVYVDSGRFFYQGNLGAAEIPWDINISYFLDGNYIRPDQIGGRSGHIMIVLDICKNEKFPDTYFYKNLGVQATVLLNATDCTNIYAPGAVIANNGKNKQLSYTILPNNGGIYNINFDAVDFEMQSITINGIILNMDINVDLTEAKSKMRTLGSATSSIDTGAQKVNFGAETLKTSTTGISVYKTGVGEGSEHICGMKEVWVGFINNYVGSDKVLRDLITVDNCTNPASYVDNYGNIILSNESHPAYEFVKYLYSGCIMTDSLDTLENGISTLASGTSALASGTSALASSTSGLDDTIQSMVDEMLEPITGGDGYIRSFTSVKNVDIKSIQFAMHTDVIEVSDEVITETVKELSLWERILKLFGIYNEE